MIYCYLNNHIQGIESPESYIRRCGLTRKTKMNNQYMQENHSLIYSLMKSDRKKSSLYGESGDIRAVQDAMILIQMIYSNDLTLKDVQEGTEATYSPKFFDQFCRLGGDDSHSGGSFYGVKASCVNMIGGWNAFGGKNSRIELDVAKVKDAFINLFADKVYITDREDRVGTKL